MIRKMYKCLACGQTTFKNEEFQCPNCKTLDALYEIREDYSEDEGDYPFDLDDEDNSGCLIDKI